MVSTRTVRDGPLTGLELHRMYLQTNKICLGADAANKFKDDNDVVIVAYQDDATVFVAVADSIDDYQFGLLDADAAAALNVEKGQIVLFKDFDDNRVDFDSDLTHDDLSKFIKSEALPLGNALTYVTYLYILAGDFISIILEFGTKCLILL